MTAVIRYVGVSIIQGQLALGVIVGKSDLSCDILITDKEAAELAIQIIRHLRDATASPLPIERARTEGALAALQAVRERGSELSIWDTIDAVADEYGGFDEIADWAVSP